MPAIRVPKLCSLYSPGHHPHWIQARKGREDRENPPVLARFIDATPVGLILIEVEDRELRIWNHDPVRLAEAAAFSKGIVTYQARWRLLSAGGGYLFCAAVPPEDHVHCEAPYSGYE